MFAGSSIDIKKVLLWALVIALPLLAVRAIMDREPPSVDKDPEQQIVDNMTVIHRALSEYTRDKGYSPMSFAEVVATGYLDKLIAEGVISEFPRNPYSGQPVREIPWGQPPVEGDFLYLPAVEYDGDKPQSTGMHLLAYGMSRQSFMGGIILDSDGDGNADPVALVISKNSGTLKGTHLEPLEDTLARLGYTRPLDTRLP